MHPDSISPLQRKTGGHKQSAVDESLSFSISETSAQGRRLHDRSAIFPSRFNFALAIMGLQTGVMQLMFIFNQAEKYGGVLIFLITFLITICISLPLMSHQLFYGFYNKFGYVKIWNKAPIGFGIGLSMALYSVYECVIWAAVAGLLILHVCRVPFRSISEWTTCKKIERPEKVLCYNAQSKLPPTSCELTTYPALEFYKEISYEPQLEGTGYIGINTPWFLCCLMVWLIVFVMVSQGFRRLRHILIKISIFCLVSIILLAAFSFGAQNRVSSEGKKEIFHVQKSPTRYTIIWLVWYTIRVVQIPLGTLIQLGSYAPAGFPVLSDPVMISLFVCFYNFAFAYFAHCCHVWVEQNFDGIKKECLAPDPMTALFASIPTAISFLAMGNLWLFVFYTTFALKTIIQIVITLTATMNAMSEMFHLHRHRQQIVAVLCTVALLLNLPPTMINSELFFNRTFRYVEILVDFAIVNFAGMITMCLYTASRIFDDVHFTYNAEPVLFQKFSSYLSPVLMIFVFITGFAMVVERWLIEPLFVIDPWAGPFIGIMAFLLLAPIPVTALYMYVVHLMRHDISAMLQPTANWGPPEADVRHARLKFNPRRELRHVSKKPCTHNCLLNNSYLKNEDEKRESQRKEFFLNIFPNPSLVEWDNDAYWHYRGDVIEKARAIAWTVDIRRVLNPTLTMKTEEEQWRIETEEEIDEGGDAGDTGANAVADALEDVNSKEDLEENVKFEGDTGDINAVVDETLMLEKGTEIKTEMDFEPDIILPDLNSIELHSGIQRLDAHDVADGTLPLPRYSVEHPTYLRQRKSRQEPLTESAVEPVSRVRIYSPRKLSGSYVQGTCVYIHATFLRTKFCCYLYHDQPVTRKIYWRVNRKPKGQSRSKSCQTDKGLKRLQNLLYAILPWKKGNRKKHRCVGTSSGCRKPPTSRGSSTGSETLSEMDEWP